MMFAFSYRDYERCDQEGEEEGRMEGKKFMFIRIYFKLSRRFLCCSARIKSKLKDSVWIKSNKVSLHSYGLLPPLPGADRGPAEHEDVVVLLQDDGHHDRGHHQ